VARWAIGAAGVFDNDAGEAFALLWNPHGTLALRVHKWAICHRGAIVAATVQFTRFSAAGTAGGTFTPDADNALDRKASAAPSGALFYRGNFTVAPTVKSAFPMMRWRWGEGAASQVSKRYEKRVPLLVPPGEGVGFLCDVAGVNWVADWEWDE
jgi:hypothetical protein